MLPSVNHPLPTAAELPCSDDIPVDNEDQKSSPQFTAVIVDPSLVRPHGLVLWRGYGDLPCDWG